eukprot:SAG31_NODE_564_length_14059_cov_5.728940_5_plen_103_part_00
MALGVDQLGDGSFTEVKYLLPAVARLYDVLFRFEESGGDVSLVDIRRSFGVAKDRRQPSSTLAVVGPALPPEGSWLWCGGSQVTYLGVWLRLCVCVTYVRGL